MTNQVTWNKIILEEFINLALLTKYEEMKSSSDFQEEREMVRDKLREMFSVYQ